MQRYKVMQWDFACTCYTLVQSDLSYAQACDFMENLSVYDRDWYIVETDYFRNY